MTRQFKALLTAAKLPDMRLHDLRHSCATLLLAQGVNPRVVMETLGHSQVSLTLNTYSHVLPALQRDAAARMNAVLADPEPLVCQLVCQRRQGVEAVRQRQELLRKTGEPGRNRTLNPQIKSLLLCQLSYRPT